VSWLPWNPQVYLIIKPLIIRRLKTTQESDARKKARTNRAFLIHLRRLRGKIYCEVAPWLGIWFVATFLGVERYPVTVFLSTVLMTTSKSERSRPE
jgi:hypothetical protein